MCGIGGIVSFASQAIPEHRLLTMRHTLEHRGPDGLGLWAGAGCGLAHSRLSIIDLLSGEQPMSLRAPETPEQTKLALIFNGEIYNHRSLRKKLERFGHRFGSNHSDTEVILHGYEQWGDQLPKLLQGMFAFAIWDVPHRRLILCRDRTGMKPLFYAFTGLGAQRGLIFGSLPSTVLAGMASDRQPEVDRTALLTYLRLGYVFDRLLIEGIAEVPAGHWMSVEADGTLEFQRYWRPPPISRTSTSLGVVGACREVLSEAVEKRLAADVPLGCFLSGGIDSSVVAALAQEQLRDVDAGPLQTFSVRMPAAGYDETPFAQRVAEHLGTVHTVLDAPVDRLEEQFFGDLERLMAYSGEPTADSSLLASYWLAQAARQRVKVALSGDGGDEMFGGYDRYRAMRLLRQHRVWLSMLPLIGHERGDVRSLRSRVNRLAHAARAKEPAEQYRRMIRLFEDAQIDNLGLMPSDRRWPDEDDPAAPLPLWPDEPNPVHAAMRWDLWHYLPFVLLRKVDRASMSVGLEVRCPMLDTAVLDLAGHLPETVLMPQGRPKGLLRRVAADLLPADVAQRRKKGFSLPIGSWFAGPLHRGLRDRLLDGTLAGFGANQEVIERMLESHIHGVLDHTHRLFALLQLWLWLRWRAGVETQAEAPSVEAP